MAGSGSAPPRRASPRRAAARRAGSAGRIGRLLIDLVQFLLVTAATVAVLGAVRGDGRPVPVVPDRAVLLQPTRSGAAARSALAELTVLDRRPHRPGYERACGRSGGCVFGEAWSDAVDVPLGHNGVDTRTDVIARDTGADGVLVDPYSGNPTAAVQIDHVVPLAAAWDLGAADWPAGRRRDFANDPAELLAVDAEQNQVKSDLIPGDWAGCLRAPGPCRRARPPVWTPRPGIRCAYAQRYIQVCAAWGLPVTARDVVALRDMVSTCPG